MTITTKSAHQKVYVVRMSIWDSELSDYNQVIEGVYLNKSEADSAVQTYMDAQLGDPLAWAGVTECDLK